jgi:S-adenosyl-L-methionine hydrolase (adenosine-forming)
MQHDKTSTLVTLTTDFGTRDSYVAQLKGVLYAQGPSDLRVIDLSHDIAPQQVVEAALFVREAWPRFPTGTIHIVVVDPGVGSARRALVCRHAGQLLLGPDNGVMALALNAEHAAFALQPERFVSSEVSATFHGRDVFAPAAARLAHGASPEQLGEPVADLVQLSLPAVQGSRSQLRGVVLHVDRFGNLISNISRAELSSWLGPRDGSLLRVRVGNAPAVPLVRCYADAAVGSTVALIGSSELLEVAVSNGDAAQQLGVGSGAEVVLSAASSPA